jgi:hypothetical protein
MLVAVVDFTAWACSGCWSKRADRLERLLLRAGGLRDVCVLWQ